MLQRSNLRRSLSLARLDLCHLLLPQRSLFPLRDSGTSAVQLPRASATAVTGCSFPIVTVTVESGSAVPLIVVSPAATGSMVGVSVCSAAGSAANQMELLPSSSVNKSSVSRLD